MASKKFEIKNADTGPHRARGTPEGKEAQLIALAYDCVEERLRNGTATAQETTYFLKLGSEQARLEKRELQERIKLLEAKTDSLDAAKRIESMYDDVIKAVLSYRSPVNAGLMVQDRHND